tara:strand:- start:34 stop:372 length:339 start_codon:yes stop_codon:yes gene_type:complete
MEITPSLMHKWFLLSEVSTIVNFLQGSSTYAIRWSMDNKGNVVVMFTPKMNTETLQTIEQAFKSFDKWETYNLAFGLMDARKVTLTQIVEIAGRHGIKEGVIRMRREDYLHH